MYKCLFMYIYLCVYVHVMKQYRILLCFHVDGAVAAFDCEDMDLDSQRSLYSARSIIVSYSTAVITQQASGPIVGLQVLRYVVYCCLAFGFDFKLTEIEAMPVPRFFLKSTNLSTWPDHLSMARPTSSFRPVLCQMQKKTCGFELSWHAIEKNLVIASCLKIQTMG